MASVPVGKDQKSQSEAVSSLPQGQDAATTKLPDPGQNPGQNPGQDPEPSGVRDNVDDDKFEDVVILDTSDDSTGATGEIEDEDDEGKIAEAVKLGGDIKEISTDDWNKADLTERKILAKQFCNHQAEFFREKLEYLHRTFAQDRELLQDEVGQGLRNMQFNKLSISSLFFFVFDLFRDGLHEKMKEYLPKDKYNLQDPTRLFGSVCPALKDLSTEVGAEVRTPSTLDGHGRKYHPRFRTLSAAEFTALHLWCAMGEVDRKAASSIFQFANFKEDLQVNGNDEYATLPKRPLNYPKTSKQRRGLTAYERYVQIGLDSDSSEAEIFLGWRPSRKQNNKPQTGTVIEDKLDLDEYPKGYVLDGEDDNDDGAVETPTNKPTDDDGARDPEDPSEEDDPETNGGVTGDKNDAQRSPEPEAEPPFIGNPQDRETVQTWVTLAQYKPIPEALWRTCNTQPRVVIRDVIRCIRAGLVDGDWAEVGVKPLPGDFVEDKPGALSKTKLRLATEAEVKWLQFLTRNSYFRTQDTVVFQLEHGMNSTEKNVLNGLLRRTVELLGNTDRDAMFTKQSTKYGLDDFVEELNRNDNNPLVFTRDVVSRYLPCLAARNLLVLHSLNSNLEVSRGRAHRHPEHCIRWDIEAAIKDGRYLRKKNEQTGRWMPGEYVGQAHMEAVVPAQPVLDAKVPADHFLQTARFYRNMAYRFGLLLRELLRKAHDDMKKLKSERERHANRRYLATFVMSRDPKIPARYDKKGSSERSRGTGLPSKGRFEMLEAQFKGVKKLRLKQNGVPNRDARAYLLMKLKRRKQQKVAAERARKGKKDISALQDIYLGRTHFRKPQLTTLKNTGTRPQPYRKRLFQAGTNKVQDASNDKKRKLAVEDEEDTYKPWRPRREGDPEPRLGIRTFDIDTGEDMVARTPPPGLGPGEEYVRQYLNAKKFRRGEPEYWTGDTPYQRRFIENQIRSRLESGPTGTWFERVSGTNKRRRIEKQKDEDEYYPLPSLGIGDTPSSADPRDAGQSSGYQRVRNMFSSLAGPQGDDRPGSAAHDAWSWSSWAPASSTDYLNDGLTDKQRLARQDMASAALMGVQLPTNEFIEQYNASRAAYGTEALSH